MTERLAILEGQNSEIRRPVELLATHWGGSFLDDLIQPIPSELSVLGHLPILESKTYRLTHF